MVNLFRRQVVRITGFSTGRSKPDTSSETLPGSGQLSCFFHKKHLSSFFVTLSRIIRSFEPEGKKLPLQVILNLILNRFEYYNKMFIL